MNAAVERETNKLDVEAGIVPASSRACAPTAAESGFVIVNADDWGRDRATTDRSLDCFLLNAISSVSAMVFMCDSKRASNIALDHRIDAGLHLNFTTLYSSPQCPPRLIEHQNRLSRYLNSCSIARVLYHPALANSFEYVARAQFEEFERLYGICATRIDGHHHMHLSANVLFGRFIPAGCIARRNLTFNSGEKRPLNRLYRRWQDRSLARKYRLTDYFFDLKELIRHNRVQRILELASHFDVEIETHPIMSNEYAFLTKGGLVRSDGSSVVARGYALRNHNPHCENGVSL